MKRTKKKLTEIKDLKGNEVIESPLPGSIVEHSGWSPGGQMKGYPCDVYIVHGQFEVVSGIISNYWTWRKILFTKPGDPFLGPEESGYGSFRTAKKQYEIKIEINLKKK